MNLWTAIAVIVLAGSAVEIYRAHLKGSNGAGSAVKEELKRISDQLKKQEQRLANLESIILDLQREEPFRDLK